MFDKLIFLNENEKTEFEKYTSLKGIYLYKQVYDILLELNCNNSVKYKELSSIIRYDKNLRDTIYKYLATVEEYLRALLCEKYDVNEEEKAFEGHNTRLKEALFSKTDSSKSNLYLKLKSDFSILMDVCIDKKLIKISPSQKKHIKDLRNHTMHHNLLLLGNAINVKSLHDNFNTLENQLNDFIELLPCEYKKGFLSDIKKLNGHVSRPFLRRFYLEVDNGKLRICT
jgi:hypothetical protein